MEVWIPLKEIARADMGRIGGKAAHLGELMRAGLPVPDGFVVCGGQNARQHSPAEWTNGLLAAFDHLRNEYVAVRSSAVNEDGKNASWAGQLNTFLYVPRRELVTRIEDCWRSAHSAHAVAYAHEHHLDPGQIAVIIQAMVPSTSSGVAFSVHPVTKNHDHIIIEAGLGLGEAVVSGQITPDTYVVHKKSGKIIERHIVLQAKQLIGDKRGGAGPVWHPTEAEQGSAQKLHDRHIATLSRYVRTIETHFGYPVDVEWAFAHGQLYITQARPITTLA